MGLYDSVLFECTKCGSQMEAQSKRGDCALDQYEKTDERGYVLVPVAIAETFIDEEDEIECDFCKTKHRIAVEDFKRMVNVWVEEK